MTNIKAVWKFRLDQLTYGFIYTAFLGNMIYDLILMTKGDEAYKFSSLETVVCGLITIFYVLDYVHLNADMKDIVVANPRLKSFVYIFCDILTSILIFFGFVATKLHSPEYAVIFISSIPILFLLYKCEIRRDRNLQLMYTILSLGYGMYFCYFYFYITKGPICDDPLKYLYYLCLGTLIWYALYVLVIFDLFIRDKYSDLNQ